MKINFSELQIRIFEEILKNKEGITFEDLKNRFSMSVQGMQGHLGAMTANGEHIQEVTTACGRKKVEGTLRLYTPI